MLRRLLVSLLSAILLCMFPVQYCAAEDFHVSVDGSDASDGTVNRPWKTIQHAVSKCRPGDSVLVHEGTYRELLSIRRSGNAKSGPIVLRNFSEDKVVLDGSNARRDDVSPIIEIQSQKYLTIAGLELCNLKTDHLNETPVAIRINGACSIITIENCKIHDIGSLATPNKNNSGRDAHGIAVFGDEATPITDLKIVGNELHDLTLGSSEALVVNGNVDGFEIRKNVIRDCDNIGIDCIGFEGVSPNSKTDQVRNGIVAENRVFNVGTSQNPSYKGERTAAGIYVDGGTEIVIERNLVHGCDFGIEVASEKKGKVTDKISVRNNILHSNVNAGLIIGGYNKSSTGDAHNCSITNNTFYNNDTEVDGDEWGQIHLQHRVEDCVFANNILVNEIEKNGCNLFVVQWPKSGKNIRFANNQFFGLATPVWVFRDQWMEEWAEYQSHEFSAENDNFGDPLMSSPKNGKFDLRKGSVALDSGDSTVVTAKQLDFDGQPRVSGSSVDRGAIEFSQ